MSTRPTTPAGAYRIQPPSAHGAGPSVQPVRRTSGLLSRPRRGSSLRTRLVVAMLSVALLPLLATSVGGVYLAHQSLIHQGEQVLQRRARASAATIDGYLAGIRSSLVSSSAQVANLVAADPSLSPATRSTIRDVLVADSAANDFHASGSTEYDTLDGHVAISDQQGEEGLDLSRSPTVQAALAPSTLTGNVTVSGVTFDPTGSSDLRETMDAAAPVYMPASAGTRLIGVLRERFSVGNIVSRVLRDQDSQGGGGLLIEPDTGLVIAQSIDPSNHTFATIAPLSSTTMQQLAGEHRYAEGAPQTRLISGLDVALLRARCPAEGCAPFTAGTFADVGAVTMHYARVDIDPQLAPTLTPWVYLLGRPEAAMTAPADLLELVAVIVGIVSLLAALIAGFSVARWSSSWLGAALQQLGSTATAFLALSNEQRQTAEEQRHRLAGARASLQDLHHMAGELSEAIERGIGAAEETARGHANSLPYHVNQPVRPTAFPPTEAQRRWWMQWSVAVRDRLRRQHDICNQLTRDVHITAETAGRMRQRSAAVSAQAAAIEISLWRGNAAVPRTTQVGAAPSVPPPSYRAKRAVSAGFGTSTLRLVLLSLLAAFGLLPSVVFASSTNTPLRSQLTNQSTQAQLDQARSRATALDALLSQQQREVAGLIHSDADLSAISQSHDLGAVAAATAPNLGTLFLEVADTDGKVVAASDRALVGTSSSSLAVFQHAVRSHPTETSPAYYDPATHQGWYYVAAPIRTTDQRSVLGVAIGKFALQRVWQLMADSSMQANADDGSFTLIVERTDAITLADSRQQRETFVASGQLGQSTLDSLWRDGRYPSGQMPSVNGRPEVARQVLAAGSANGERSFTSAPTARTLANQYWLIPLVYAPWDLVEAQPITVATAIADELTRLDLLLSLAVTVLTVALALIVAQSIIVPIQRLRARFRQIAHRLVAITRRQEDAARRQELVLPPIEATAELLGLETEEVTQLIFARPASAPVPAQALPQPPNWVEPGNWVSSSGPSQFAGGTPSRHDAGWPAVVPAAQDAVPATDALRQARVMADDWNLRQQRILADLASALNATDELGRASQDGQREATDLAKVAEELAASTR